MYNGLSFIESWKRAEATTRQHGFLKRPIIRLGHAALIYGMSANPHGYPVPDNKPDNPSSIDQHIVPETTNDIEPVPHTIDRPEPQSPSEEQ